MILTDSNRKTTFEVFLRTAKAFAYDDEREYPEELVMFRALIGEKSEGKLTIRRPNGILALLKQRR